MIIQAPTNTRTAFFIKSQIPLRRNRSCRLRVTVGPAVSKGEFLFIALLCFLFLMASCGPAFSEDIDLNKIAIIESSGNPLAWNKRDDSRGLFQITPICLKEYNNFHPHDQRTMDDLWNASISSEIANWYINVRIPQMIKYYGKEDTVENRLIAYNAGISYVKTGKPIPKITRDYIKKYQASITRNGNKVLQLSLETLRGWQK